MRDVAIIADFNIRLAHETEDIHLESDCVRAGVEALVRDPAKGIYYVAEIDGEVVGQVLITFEWSDWRNKNFWWLQSVYVDKTSRGKGIFKALYTYVVTETKIAGNVCGIRLYVVGHNATAQKAYEWLGLKKTDYEIFERMF